MEFSFNDFYHLDSKCQKILRSVLKLSRSTSLSCINEENIKNADKDVLSNIILSLVDVAENSVQVLKSAVDTIEHLRSEQVSNQKSYIELQKELIQRQELSKSVQFESRENARVVTDSVNTMMKSVVKDNERRKQIVLFGVSEDNSDLGGIVNDILECTCGPDKLSVKDYCRVGARKPGGSRPVKVYLNSQEDAQTAVKNAKSLKNSKRFGGVFIAPDRSPEERMERRRLVQLLRDKRRREPEKHHYISRGEVCSTDHHTESVINTRSNTSTAENLNGIVAFVRSLDKSFDEKMAEMNDTFAQINGPRQCVSKRAP